MYRGGELSVRKHTRMRFDDKLGFDTVGGNGVIVYDDLFVSLRPSFSEQ